MKKDKIMNVMRVVILIVGICILLYPTISNYLYQKNSTRIIEDYNSYTMSLSEMEKKKMLNSAKIYNLNLRDKWNIYDPFSNGGYKADSVYISKLNDVRGMMGYVEIPKINVKLPIYHGTDEKVLQSGIGHIYGTSLPIGGKSTHSMITGHRGLPSKMLFTELDQLEISDEFYITVLGEKIAYMVDDIMTILPEETEKLRLVEEKDYCTLVTCTPYSINTHRLLLRGTRIPYNPESFEKAKKFNKLMFAIKLLLLALLLIVLYFIYKKLKDRKEKEKERIM